MTHKDIYTKFMIEYDKANVTSSYPSLTEYEVATVLDKAYNALIAQKVTGNNVRRASFEADVKSIADLQPLVKRVDNVEFHQPEDGIIPNVMSTPLLPDCLYYLKSYLKYNTNYTNKWDTLYEVECNFDSTQSGLSDPGHIYGSNVFVLNTYDMYVDSPNNYKLEYTGYDTTFRYCLVANISNQYGEDYTAYNANIKTGTLDDIKDRLFVSNEGTWPYVYVWLDNKNARRNKFIVYRKSLKQSLDKTPYDEKQDRMVLTKLVNHDMAANFFSSASNMPWIKIPVAYIEDKTLYVVYDLLNPPLDEGSIVYIKTPHPFVKNLDVVLGETYFTPGVNARNDGEDYEFECNSTVAEELISLAVAFALENVESQRLNSKLNMRGLEA